MPLATPDSGVSCWLCTWIINSTAHLNVLSARCPPARPSADVHGQKLMQAHGVILQASQHPPIVCWKTAQSFVVGQLDVVLAYGVSQCCRYHTHEVEPKVIIIIMKLVIII